MPEQLSFFDAPVADEANVAFAALISYDTWEHERKRIVRRLRARISGVSKQDAEDAVEAAVELLFKKRLIFSEIEECSAWLFVSAAFCLLNGRKTSRRIGPLDDVMEMGADDGMIRAFENQDLIDAALEILSGEDRELLIAKLVEGISITEYARKVGSSVARLHKREQRALKRIRMARKKI